jgi:hypothetical protein
MKKKLSKDTKEILLCTLCDAGIEPDCLSEVSSHYRFEEWDFWITKKQKFWNRVTGEQGSGILFLIERIKKLKEEDDHRDSFIKSI